MSMRHVILAILARGESHGYRVRGELDALCHAARAVEASRTYTLLADLEGEGSVECRLEETVRGRTRKMYRLTDRGRALLEKWLARPGLGPSVLRRTLLVKLAVAELDEDHWPVGTWRAELEQRRRVLARLEREQRSRATSKLARLIVQRDILHLGVEIRALETLVESRAPVKRFTQTPESLRWSASR